MPCMVRKEVWLEPTQGLELEKNPPYFQKKGEEGVICAPSAKHGIVPNHVVKPYSMSKKLKFQDK